MNTWFVAATTAAAIVAASGTTPLPATAASGPVGATTSAVGAAAAPAAGGTYRPIDPYRLLDTRTSKAIPAGGSLTVTAGGIGGLPAAGIGSLALNLTAVSPGSGGWVTAYPTGTAEPTSSNLNFTAGTTAANFSVTRVNSAGSFTVVNHSTSSLNVLVDVTGYYLAGAPTGPGAFAPLNPQRLLDTRTGVGAAAKSIPAGGSVRLVVAGRGGVPTGAISAAALNFTVASPATGGYLTAYPTGESEPNASNVNFGARRTVAGAGIVKVGADGSVTLRNHSSGTVQLLADVNGYVVGGSPVTRNGYAALSPKRILDTRTGVGSAATAVPAGGTVEGQVTGVAGVPKTEVSTVALNVTATGATKPGWLIVHPSGQPRPTASNVNFAAGSTVPNTVLAKVGANGRVSIFNGSSAPVQVLADVGGAVAPADVPQQVAATVATDTTNVPNHLRGQYRWMGYGTQGGFSASTSYQRDRVTLGAINPKAGVYNWAPFDQWLNDAKSQGQSFGFRLMTYCPLCWMENSPYYPKAMPADMATQGKPDSTGTPIPAWNSEAFLSRWEAVVKATGDRYRNDPYVTYVDAGGYGAYGEMWLPYGGEAITFANWKRMVTAVATNFPRQHVFVQTMTDPTWTKWALDTFPNVGMRTDSLGAPNMHSMLAVTPYLQNYWRTRPIISEFMSQSNMATALEQIKTYHVSMISSSNMPVKYADMSATEKAAFDQANVIAGYRYSVSSMSTYGLTPGASTTMDFLVRNSGSAPTYDPQTLSAQIRNSAGTVVADVPVTGDLRSVFPGQSVTLTASLTVPSVPAGDHTVTFKARNALGATGLANAGRLSDGSYAIGKLTIG